MRRSFGEPVMTKLLRRFMRCRQGVTAIEYALLGSGVALAIVTAVGTVGTNLSASYSHIAAAFP
jgi:pilus assembly protein Flp/PilA